MSEHPPIAIRDYRSADLPFVANSWRLSLRRCYPYASIDPGWFHAAIGLIIGKLLATPAVTCRVACPPGDETLMLGYIVGNARARTLHYLFVKKDFRSGDIDGRLLADMFGTSHTDPINASAWTPAIRQLGQRFPLRQSGKALLDDICPDRPRRTSAMEQACN